ncbi:MAG: hypothetical protein ACQCXQ_04870 [Verrucomicrobiales bacterium]
MKRNAHWMLWLACVLTTVASAARLEEIRSVGVLEGGPRQALTSGPCASCRWSGVCGGGFRTRAAFANDDPRGSDLWGSDPACVLSETETGAAPATC